LTFRFGIHLQEDKAERILREETSAVFSEVLKDCGVFKATEDGDKGVERFLSSRAAQWGHSFASD
jgi:galactose-1-phosphate uridylyltransferase